MTNTAEFKAELERRLGIVGWAPTSSELQEIARGIASTRATAPAGVSSIVVKVCPGTRFLTMEGLDNSDLRTLLAMATVAAANG